MHRAEAKGVPHLLTAPSVQPIESCLDTSEAVEGYYADGAFTAAPTYNIEDKVESDVDPQEAYYATTLERFQSVAAQLRHPLEAPTLEPTTIDSLQRLASASHQEWRSYITREAPHPTLMYGLPQEAVLKGIEVLTTLLKPSKKEDSGRWSKIGGWAWSLLATCREVSEMGSEEVSVCRELGKEAVWVLRVAEIGSAPDPGISSDLMEEDDRKCPDLDETTINVGDGGLQGRVQDPVGPRATTEDSLNDQQSSPDTSKLADVSQDLRSLTLDMIITIVGEMYGQRDLLEARFIWGEEDQ